MDFPLPCMVHRKLLASLNNNDFTENTVGMSHLAKLFEIASDFSDQNGIMINMHQLNHESHKQLWIIYLFFQKGHAVLSQRVMNAM